MKHPSMTSAVTHVAAVHASVDRRQLFQGMGVKGAEEGGGHSGGVAWGWGAILGHQAPIWLPCFHVIRHACEQLRCIRTALQPCKMRHHFQGSNLLRIVSLAHNPDPVRLVHAVLCSISRQAHRIVAHAIQALNVEGAVPVEACIKHLAQVHVAHEHDAVLMRFAGRSFDSLCEVDAAACETAGTAAESFRHDRCGIGPGGAVV